MRGRRKFVVILFLAFVLPALGGAMKPYRIKKVGELPNFIELNHANGKLYATSYGSDEFLEIDLARKIVTQKLSVGSHPLGFAFANQGKTALIACKDSGTVMVVDLEKFRVVQEIKVGASPNFVSVSPSGYRAYVTNYGRSIEGQLHIINLRTRTITATMKMGASPFGMAISPVTELVYVVMGGSNEVWVVDPDGQSVVQKIPVGEAPDGIAITPDGKRAFVANSQTNDLTVIDAQLMKVLITVPVGKSPFGVDISPDGKRAFVVNTGSKNVSIVPVDLSSLDFNAFDVDKGSTNIKVGPDNRTVYVVSESLNSIMVAEIP
jgi:YVTN family beta-propeller protein